MQFESRDTRHFWVTLVLGFIADFIIAIIVAKLTASGILGFFLAFIGFQAIYFLIWVKNSLWRWLIFFIGGRKKSTNFIFDFLSENNFPEPEAYQSSSDSYLDSVANDENMPIEIRLKAAAELGVLNSYVGQLQLQNYLRISIVYENAIEQYKQSLNQK